MSRIKVLRANPRRSLAAMATLLIAVGVTAASGADFSARTVNPNNTFAAGTLSMTNSQDNAAILTASNMKPDGATATGEVQIENTGSLAGAISLSKDNLVDGTPAMSSKLNLTIVDCGTDLDCAAGTSSPVYGGTVAAMPAQALGTWATNEAHRYKFSVQLDGSAGDSYQGADSSVRFVWDAA
jgi:spore coat-associated protein N